MSAGPLVVTYPLTGRSRAIVAEELSAQRGFRAYIRCCCTDCDEKID